MQDDLNNRVSDLEGKLAGLIRYQESITSHIDDTLKNLSLIADEKLNQLLPIGSIVLYAMEPYPSSTVKLSNFLSCDGSEYEAAQFPKLYEVIKSSFSSEDLLPREGYFRVPNMGYRVPIGICRTDDDLTKDLDTRSELWKRNVGIGQKLGTEYPCRPYTVVQTRKLDNYSWYISNRFGDDRPDPTAISLTKVQLQPSYGMCFLIRAI